MNIILPIGSVDKIRDVDHSFMIFGYLQQSATKEGVVDYVAVPYPSGNISIAHQIGFKMTDITEVLFEGYITDDFKPIKELLELRKLVYDNQN